MLGTPGNLGMINYWGDWPRHFDYAVEFSFGARPQLPALPGLVAAGHSSISTGLSDERRKPAGTKIAVHAPKIPFRAKPINT
jgi:hypothetical protein